MKATGLLVLALAASSASAQTRTDVVPAGYATKIGNSWDTYIAYYPRNLPTHVQLGYDVADLSVAAARITSISFRRPNGLSNTTPAITLTFTVALSHGPKESLSFGSVFADNEGKDRTIVFNGSVKWPATGRGAGVPPFVAKVPFKSPFSFNKSKGKSLVVDIRTTGNSGGQWDRWLLDAVDEGRGSAIIHYFQRTSCVDSTGRRVRRVTYHPKKLVPGGSWSVTYNDAPRSALGIASVGFVGARGKWGGLTLPIDLKPIGAPGCLWTVASVMFWPFRIDSQGVGKVPPLPIPKSPSLAGARFFDQSMAFDPKANPAGIVPFLSFRWQIAPGKVPSTSSVVTAMDKTRSKLGWLRLGEAAIAQISY